MAYTYDGLIPNFNCYCSRSTKAMGNTNNGEKKLQLTAVLVAQLRYTQDVNEGNTEWFLM